jgi:two-component system response regulator NreC
MINVAFLNSLPVITDAFKALLDNADEIEITDSFIDIEDIHKSYSGKPIHVIITIFYNSSQKNIEIISRLTRILPKVKILILSVHNPENFILQTIKAGAKGYLDTDTNRSELMQAIYTLRNGHEYYTKTISDILLHHYLSDQKQKNKNKSNRLLSKREMEVLQLFAEGMSNRQIAEKLFISVRTVETHKNNIMKKINLKNTVDLVKFAIKNNIIQLD